MNDWLTFAFAGLEPVTAITLYLASFLGSFISAAMGLGGGIVLLSIMASLLPVAALIPVHGVIQLGSNITRASVMAKHIHWPPFAVFGIGTVLGAALGGVVVADLPEPLFQIGIGIFVIWSVLARPPAWLSRNPMVIGAFASFLTMFFGATGPFVANYVKSLVLKKQAHVATHATLMTLQHSLKIVVFGVLGFAFGPWILFITLMIISGVLGTLAGRAVLMRMNEALFKKVLNTGLLLISAQLIWKGVSGLL